MIGPGGFQVPVIEGGYRGERAPSERTVRMIDFHIIQGATPTALIDAWDDWRLDSDNAKVKVHKWEVEFTDASNGWCIYVFYSK